MRHAAHIVAIAALFVGALYLVTAWIVHDSLNRHYR